MDNDYFNIVKEKFNDGYEGDALLLNTNKIKNDYDYIGLWYAKDGNEKTYITTEIYYSEDNYSVKPSDFAMELKENSFKIRKREQLSVEKNWIWIAARNDNDKYCGLKVSSCKKGKIYVPFKLIHNKKFGFDLINKGIFKGGQALFFAMGSEDFESKLDYSDAIMFIVFLKDMPPEDWRLNIDCIGIENLPIFANTAKLTDDKKYSSWFEQNPEIIKK